MEQLVHSEFMVADTFIGFGNTDTEETYASLTPVVDVLQPMLKGFAFIVTAVCEVTLSVAVTRMKQVEEFTAAGTFHW